jgi:hypothetical protein
MLSEKAKGKQRAVDLPPEFIPLVEPTEPESEPEPARDLIIRFTEGLPDLVITVSQQDAVRDVKKKVRVHSSFL